MTEKIIHLENYRYHIDIVAENIISGWVFKTDDVNNHAIIEVRSGDTLLWCTKAENFREDLKEAGFGNGDYGFILIPTADSITHTVTNVSIYIDGVLVQDNIPFSMMSAVKSIDFSNYRIHLDYYDTETIKGWVFKGGREQHRAKVEVRSGDTIIASGVAINFRKDLLEANIGDGAYGFSLTPRQPVFISGECECECELYVDGDLSPVDAFVLNMDK